MGFTLSKEEKYLLLATARESIRTYFTGGPSEYGTPTENLLTKCGAFVTLHKAGELRGCIGHITGINPLFNAVKELARSSAFHDPRFPPLKQEELATVDIEISVLTPLRKIVSPQEVKVGTHGVLLESGSRTGVLLPQVPVEQGWDRAEFLKHLCYKAGLPPEDLTLPETQLSIFEAIVFGEGE